MTMPDQASKRAAEEIELRLHTLLQECHKFSQGETWPIAVTIRDVARREIAAIERHMAGVSHPDDLEPIALAAWRNE
ncbi:MAG: hypothetical protein LUC93_16480 [Planctomycetaceae bacterium]|nr:hypothetical protein [Planctomycetaceae bacterium]